MTSLPRGFTCHVANIGVKDDTDDFVVIAAERPVAAAGVFTRSRFAGPSVLISREHVVDLTAQAVVVVSKNANVANGPDGLDDARQLVDGVAARLGCDAGRRARGVDRRDRQALPDRPHPRRRRGAALLTHRAPLPTTPPAGS